MGIQIVGVHTMPIPHGLDGSISQFPYSCHSHIFSTHWMDGRQDGLCLSMTVQSKVEVTRNQHPLHKHIYDYVMFQIFENDKLL